MELENRGKSAYSTLVVSIAVVFAVAMVVFVAKPLIDSNAKLDQEKDKQAAEYKRESKKLEILKTAKNDEDKLNSLRDKVQVALPQGDDRTGTYAQIEAISNQSGVDTKSVRESGNSNSKNNSAIHEVSFNIDSIGTYDSFLKNLQEFESSLRIFNVKKINVSPKAGGQIEYNLNVSSYYKDEVQLED